MPDLASRGAHEAAITRAVAPLLAEQRANVARRVNSGWADFRRRLSDALAVHLQAVYVDASEGFYAAQGFKADLSRVEPLAAAWARGYARELAATMTENLQANVAAAVERAAAEAKEAGDKEIKQRVIAALLMIFDDSRAETVGITETTRSITAGELASADSMRKTSTGRLVAVDKQGTMIGGQRWPGAPSGAGTTDQPPGETIGKRRLTFVATWNSMRDGKVCKVCRPLHGKPRGEWGVFEDGPPAHPACRCWITWRLMPTK